MIPNNTLCYTKDNIACESKGGAVVTVVGHSIGYNKIEPAVICVKCGDHIYLCADNDLIPINPPGIAVEEPAVVVKPRTKKEKVTS